MNFLGHFYLGRYSNDLLLGNFIADAVKGNKYENYPEGIKNGILQHRFIDDFTDNNEYTKQILQILYPVHKKYSSVIVDLYYDHFLINHWSLFHNSSSSSFILKCYDVLEDNVKYMPSKVEMMFRYLVAQNWIEDYRTTEGLHHIFLMMKQRMKYENNFHLASQTLFDNYDLIKDLSLSFLQSISVQNHHKIKEFM
jgi:acyl carrier protein phosphodiesterase